MLVPTSVLARLMPEQARSEQWGLDLSDVTQAFSMMRRILSSAETGAISDGASAAAIARPAI